MTSLWIRQQLKHNTEKKYIIYVDQLKAAKKNNKWIGLYIWEAFYTCNVTDSVKIESLSLWIYGIYIVH